MRERERMRERAKSIGIYSYNMVAIDSWTG